MIRRKHRPQPFIPLASMGDIAFLLIIFFMLTSNFIKEAHVKIDPARSPDIDRLKESGISVSVDEDGETWLQGTPCSVGFLRRGVEALLEDRDEKVVMLKIDRNVPQDTFGEVFLELSKAGAELALVGTEE